MPSLSDNSAILPRQRGNVDSLEVEPDRNNSLSGGAIAGIVVGILVAVALIIFASWWFMKAKRRREMKDVEAQKNMSLDARSSVGTRPSNATAPIDQPQLDRNTAARDYAGEPKNEVSSNSVQPPPEAATNDVTTRS